MAAAYPPGNLLTSCKNSPAHSPKKISMIFGRQVAQEYKGRLQTVIEDPGLPNPVIRSHYIENRASHQRRVCLRRQKGRREPAFRQHRR